MPIVVTMAMAVENQGHQAAAQSEAEDGAQNQGYEPVNAHLDIGHGPPKIGAGRYGDRKQAEKSKDEQSDPHGTGTGRERKAAV